MPTLNAVQYVCYRKLGASLSLIAILFLCPDVYSYDEDDMVLDSKLPEHLSHFGIDMMTMEKASSVTGLYLMRAHLLVDIFSCPVSYKDVKNQICQDFLFDLLYTYPSTSHSQKYCSTLCFLIQVS